VIVDGGGWRISDEEKRASFEIVELSTLPAAPKDLDVLPGDWFSIAAAAVAYVEDGGNPLDGRAVNAFARARLAQSADRSELFRLFADPIVYGRGDMGFTNGRHRVHVMRLAGVERCVIYTKAGERL
jgi:hypothetical protein